MQVPEISSVHSVEEEGLGDCEFCKVSWAADSQRSLRVLYWQGFYSYEARCNTRFGDREDRSSLCYSVRGPLLRVESGQSGG